MKGRSALVLLALALALGAYVFFWERKRPTSEEAAEKAKRLLDVSSDSIGWIEIDRDGTQVRLERTGGEGSAGRRGWRLTAPISDRADGFQAGALADAIAGIETRRSFDASAPPPPDTEAGLDPPRWRLRFAAGGAPEEILIGREAPGTGAVYLRVAGSGATVLAAGSLTAGLDRSVEDWRDRMLLDMTTLDLEEAAIVAPPGPEGGTLRFRRKGEDWHIAEPVEDEAQGSKVQGTLSSLLSLRAEAFRPDGAVPPGAFRGPGHRVRLVRRGGEAEEIVFGAQVGEADGRVFATVSGRPGVIELPATILDELGTDPGPYRSLAVAGLPEHEVAALTLESQGRRLSFEKKEGVWSATAPEGFEADPVEIERTVRDLVALRAESIAGPAGDPGAYGLEPPRARAELARSAGDDGTAAAGPVVIRFGGPAGEAGRIHVMRDGRPWVLVAPGEFLERFAAEVHARPSGTRTAGDGAAD